MTVRMLAPVAVALLVLGLAGCDVQTPEQQAASLEAEANQHTDVQFATVTSNVSTGFYTAGPTATGVTDMDGAHLTVPITVSHDAGYDIWPTATITLPDGSTITCSEDDPRHQTALVEATTSVDLPCKGLMPDAEDAAKSRVDFEDDGQ